MKPPPTRTTNPVPLSCRAPPEALNHRSDALRCMAMRHVLPGEPLVARKGVAALAKLSENRRVALKNTAASSPLSTHQNVLTNKPAKSGKRPDLLLGPPPTSLSNANPATDLTDYAQRPESISKASAPASPGFRGQRTCGSDRLPADQAEIFSSEAFLLYLDDLTETRSGSSPGRRRRSMPERGQQARAKPHRRTNSQASSTQPALSAAASRSCSPL
ncbi:Uncharacterised protein [Mycobacteroides abscessus subsp. massiliense]|nr:Uncharacterised protein [Mycobacteroides abscessus subsp. abscessus]SKQ85805.1 Uncharacterised protein [Mycobacteroides abscessus subsp. massiliense]SLC48750.1 Uncharacterised protein [Mycobacteroides abscessus subsp. massiliense]